MDPAMDTPGQLDGNPTDRVDTTDVIDRTALMRAAATAQGAELVRSLLAAGASVDLKDGSGKTALMWAVEGFEGGKVEALRLLFGVGRAAVDLQDQWGRTALMRASGRYDPDEVLRPLLEAGASVDLRDKESRTALMYASGFGGGAELVRLLLAAGASVDLQEMWEYGSHVWLYGPLWHRDCAAVARGRGVCRSALAP